MAEPEVRVRNTEPRDFAGIGDLCRRVYPEDSPWTPEQLASHLKVFAPGQYVATFGPDEKIVGMSSSLIVRWDHYDMFDTWDAFTAYGMLTNHDPNGHTLYGVEAIVDPELQGHGIGHKLTAIQKDTTHKLGLWRMRGGGRLRDYHLYASRLTAAEYVVAVVHGQILDHTLTFQLHEGFHVLAVIPHYLSSDSETLGWAALIEWLNPDTVQPHHFAARPTRFLHRDVVRRDHQR
jgi:ribosomal protein S18 acetylase RimI-like enzyme